MRHRYECPMRWADLDLLGHVNNVVYVDYLQEARVDMLRVHASDSRAHDLAEGVVVVRHEVTFLAPLLLRDRPVSIESWVTEVRAASFTMAYEIFDEDEDGRTTYARASTVLTPYVFAEERPRRIGSEERAALERFLEPVERVRPERWQPVTAEGPGRMPLYVRFSDVDVYGHVNNVKYFEYVQEARIRLFRGLTGRVAPPDGWTGRMVVAQTDVDYRLPLLFRSEPYETRTRITRVGRTSLVMDTEIADGEDVYARARAVAVFWDPASGRAVEPPAEYREQLLAAAG